MHTKNTLSAKNDCVGIPDMKDLQPFIFAYPNNQKPTNPQTSNPNGEKKFFITHTGLNFENCIKLDKVNLPTKKLTCIQLDMETRNGISQAGFVKTRGPKAQ